MSAYDPKRTLGAIGQSLLAFSQGLICVLRAAPPKSGHAVIQADRPVASRRYQAMLLVRLPFEGARGFPWIVELIGLAKAADAADRRHALLPGEKAAIRAAVTAIDGAPPSIIDGQRGCGRLRQHRWHHYERRYSSKTHPRALLLLLN